MLKETFKKLKGDLVPMGVKTTSEPEQHVNINEVFLNAKNQLMIEIPKHRKPTRFYLNRLRLVS